MAMIDHLGIPVADLARSIAFYERALAPLDYGLVMKWGQGAGFGPKGKPALWIATRPEVGPIEGGRPPTDRIHIALLSRSRAAVRAFYEAALAAGGRDNGPPGVREHYHPDYYGAFVFDLDGHNLEAVCHEPYLG